MREVRQALVTGGAEGIGLAIAEALAAAGCRVTIADLDGTKAAERAAALGVGHSGIACDITVEAQAIAAAASAPFEILVNNAGIGDSHLPTLEQGLDAFRKVLDVHLSGTFLMSREVARGMVERGSGAIVNLSSIAGITGLPKRNAYGAAKAGIVAMTKAMACEWAGRRVRVNAVAPGLTIATDDYSAAQVERLAARMPLGALPTPAQIADAVIFLARAEAVTGQTIFVDGGAHLAPMGRDFVALDRD